MEGGKGSAKSQQQQQQQVCRFYKEGACRFGAECRNLHPGSPVPQRVQPAKAKQGASGASASPLASSNTAAPAAAATSAQAEEEEDEKKKPFRPSDDIVKRIQWDPDVDAGLFKVGYEDRFIGVIEKNFNDFTWADISSLSHLTTAIPQHRIVHFKYRDTVIWHRRDRIDHVFGSNGGMTLHEIVAEADAKFAEEQAEADRIAQEEAEAGKKARKVKKQAAAAATAVGEQAPANEEESEESDDVEESPNASAAAASAAAPLGRRFAEDKSRPNFFLCIRCDDPKVVEIADVCQQHVNAVKPELAPGFIPLSALHVTLITLRIDTEEEMQRAVAALNSAREAVSAALPPAASGIQVEGVSSFGDRVLHGQIGGPNLPRLERAVAILEDALTKARVSLVGNHKPWTPHMTLAKPNREMTRQNINVDDQCHRPLKDLRFGTQRVEAIHLCKMTPEKSADGFYIRYATLLNAPRATPVDAAFLSLFDKINGASSDADIDAGSPKKIAFIMRGVSGSGKSSLAERLASSVAPQDSALVSSDAFFTQNGASYEDAFSVDKIKEAHQFSRAAFKKALEDKKRVVVVDNTNSTLGEYSGYAALAEKEGYEVQVVEFQCASLEQLSAISQRNRHAVPIDVARRMYARWESDPKALLVAPALGSNLATFVPVQRRRGPLAASAAEQQQRAVSPQLVLQAPVAAPAATSGPSLRYVGVFLTLESRQALLKACPPRHSKIVGEHLTLCFQPSAAVIASLPVGETCELKVIGVAADGAAQAVLVEILDERVKCFNEHPHITLSLGPGVQAVQSNTLVAGAVEAKKVVPLTTELVLQGVVGGGVLNPDRTQSRVLNRDRLFTLAAASSGIAVVPAHVSAAVASASTSGASASASGHAAADLSLAATSADITALNIFDFDGTLFETPGPEEGIAQWTRANGATWPHRGWVTHAASLLPPVRVQPGPALPVFRHFSQRANTLTVIMTGRIAALRPQVESVLLDFGVWPNLLILKPAKDEDTIAFKEAAIRDLLVKHPRVATLRIWDDLPENLRSFERLKEHLKVERPSLAISVTDSLALGEKLAKVRAQANTSNSMVQMWLQDSGLIRPEVFARTVQSGLRFIQEAWAATILEEVGAAWSPATKHITREALHEAREAICMVYGSHPLGRIGDVDVCLFAPAINSKTHWKWLVSLDEQFRNRGVGFTYLADSPRCPRIRVRLSFDAHPAIDFDMILAVVPLPLFNMQARVASDDGVAGGLEKPFAFDLTELHARALSAGDDKSANALDGLVFLGRALAACKAASLPTNEFGRVIEMCKTALRWYRTTGTGFHAIRTFQLVILLVDFVEHHAAEVRVMANLQDGLFRAFMLHLAALTSAALEAVFGNNVPAAFLGYFHDMFAAIAAELATHSSLTFDNILNLVVNRPAFPPRGYEQVTIDFKGGVDAVVWQARIYSLSRLPLHLRTFMKTCAAHVVPDSDSTEAGTPWVRLAIPMNCRSAFADEMVAFWREMEHYRYLGVSMEVRIGKENELLFQADGQHMVQQLDDKWKKAVEEFVANPAMKELAMPSTMTNTERQSVHILAESLGLSHESTGRSATRHIVLKKK